MRDITGQLFKVLELGMKGIVRQNHSLADRLEGPDVPLQRMGEPFLKMLGREK